MCKTLLAAHKSGLVSAPTDSSTAIEPASGVPLDLVKHCARQTLAAIQPACRSVGGGWDAALARACARRLEVEALPQAARWHRRDLVPALLTTWRAVLRALPRRPAHAPPSQLSLPPPSAG